jgi:hypothetical protein
MLPPFKINGIYARLIDSQAEVKDNSLTLISRVFKDVTGLRQEACYHVIVFSEDYFEKSPFENTQSINAHAEELGLSNIELIESSKTGKLFGKDSKGNTYLVSEKVEKLNTDLFVSWFTPKDGDPSYMIHPKDVFQKSFSVDTFYVKGELLGISDRFGRKYFEKENLVQYTSKRLQFKAGEALFYGHFSNDILLINFKDSKTGKQEFIGKYKFIPSL